MIKKIPQRTCVGCRNKKDKKDLTRIVCNKENDINIDKTGKMQGRGAYICEDISCLEKVIKSKALERAFEKNIKEEIYEKLRGVIIDK